jgi:hypothetical protein
LGPATGASDATSGFRFHPIIDGYAVPDDPADLFMAGLQMAVPLPIGWGDLAFDVGAFTTTAPDGTTLNSGKYIVVWKRDRVGAWKTYRDIFHWDIAPGDGST